MTLLLTLTQLDYSCACAEVSEMPGFVVRAGGAVGLQDESCWKCWTKLQIAAAVCAAKNPGYADTFHA